MLEYILAAIFILIVYFTIRPDRKSFFNIWFVILTPAVFIIYSVSLRKTGINLLSTIWISIFMSFMIAALMSHIPDWFKKITGRKSKNNTYDQNKKA